MPQLRLARTLSAASAFVLIVGSQALAGGGGCAADLNGDGSIGPADLGILLGAWGNNPGNPADLNGDGAVGPADLGILLGSWGANCAPAPTATQLAGRSLPSYPHFDYVRAFNTGSSIQVAIDPTRFPTIVGQSADIYIVNAKTAAQWAGDPSLTDVTPGGAFTTTFVGGTIQANTFTVEAGTLSGDGQTSIGRGYDVVIDLNQNGTLDGGDFIDGVSDEAGLYVVDDYTLNGPYTPTFSNYTVTGVTGGFTNERAYYPTNLASLGQRPLVVISHGNGHQYIWYDYLGNHLASRGYIVMSHQNNTVPGIETASTTTLQHTDAFLGQQATILSGIFNGRIDTSKIIWIGHSRGGEGIVRAYDRIRNGSFVPTNYSLANIRLLISIAPTDFLGTAQASPGQANFQLVYGAADGDVSGTPTSDIADSFNIFERAFGLRQSTYVHGADHNDFNCCGVNDFQGPAGTAIGNAEAQDVAKACMFAMIEYVLNGNKPAKDYLTRQYENLRVASVAPTTTVVSDWKDNTSAGNRIIDNFQLNPATNMASSGASIAFDVTNITEGVMNDNNTAFTWVATDPFNGMTRGRAADVTRGIVFDWAAPRFIEYTLLPAQTDLSSFAYLQFRACQGTRHPDTVAELANLNFNVTLRDGSGATQSINFGAYGGGVQEPYQRTGAGTGAGWQNEFEIIRIRLTDFLNNGSGLNLADIAAIRLDFGGAGASTRGRLGFDDLEITTD